MSPRRKKSLKKKPLKKKSKQKTDQGKNKNINNKIKRQSKIIAVLEHYIKDINNLEKTINNFEKNKLVKKKTKSKKIKKSTLRHNIPFDISMIKPNYQKTKRTMIEEEKKKNIKNQKPIFYGYDNTNIQSSSSPVYINTPYTKSRTKIPESAKLVQSNSPNSPKSPDKLSIINESSDESFNTPSSSSSSESSFSETESSYSESSPDSESPRINLMNRL